MMRKVPTYVFAPIKMVIEIAMPTGTDVTAFQLSIAFVGPDRILSIVFAKRAWTASEHL